MSRTTRDSDAEVDAKAGRKTRSRAGSGSVDSLLRRSFRVKSVSKQNESSPESPVSDSGNVSNTQLTRVTRHRASIMDSLAVTEKTRTLHSRRSSVASDVNEVTGTDSAPATPMKRIRSVVGSNVLNKSNNQMSRFTRAGSEAKSLSATAKVISRTRASSMEPETISENIKTNQLEFGTPVKTKRRASILPTEATVVEEREQIMKIPVVALQRTLPNIKDFIKIDAEKSSLEQTCKLSPITKNKLNTSHVNIDKEKTEDGTSAKEAHNSAKNRPSNTFEDVKTDVHIDSKKQISNDDENGSERSENISIDTIIQTESSAHNVPQAVAQSANYDTEVGLKVENSLNNSIKEQDQDLSNKENQATNIISDSQSREDIVSSVLLQSPKPLSVSNINVSKLTKKKCKSPSIETSLTAMHHYSKESSEVIDDAVISMKETSNNSDATNNSSTNVNSSIKEEDPDSSDNMQKLIVSTDTESLSEVLLNVSVDKNASSLEICENISSTDSIQIVECPENVDKADIEFTEVDKSKEPTEQISSENEECNEDANIQMDISSSHVKETTGTNEESKKDTASQITITSDKSETQEKIDEPDMSENVMEPDTVNCTESVSCSSLQDGTPSKPSDVSLVESTQSFIASKNEATTNDLQNTEKTNNSLTHTSTAQKSLDARTSTEDPTSNKNEDNITNVVKSSRSSIVTEPLVEPSEKLLEKGELLQKTSALNDSLTSKRQSLHKPESNNEQKKSEMDLEVGKKNQGSVEANDNDSDTNTANLFQDIPADEWREKNCDIDKNSVHSMSTERLDDESDTECDLVLVDREAWLAAENIKIEKEKETFDYDSDDTVLLKARRDSLKARKLEKTMVVSEDECEMNVSKRKASNINSKRKSIHQEETEDKEDVVKITEDEAQDVENAEDVIQDTEETKVAENVNKRKSITKEIEEQTTPKGNTSIRKSVGEKVTSESRKTTEVEENSSNSPADSRLSKSTLFKDVQKKRKSINRSIQEDGNKFEKSNEIKTAKERKSLNKSKSTENEMVETESENENIFTPGKKNEGNQFLHSSLKKNVKLKQLDVNLTEESDNETKEFEVSKKKNSNVLSDVNSDSDTSKYNLDSDDSQNETVEIPGFLFDGTSDDNKSDGKEEEKEELDNEDTEGNQGGDEAMEEQDEEMDGIEERIEDKVIQEEQSEDEQENFMHTSCISSDLIESVEKANLSRSTSSKITESNKKILSPYSETPPIKYLKKRKLDESTPELKLGNKFKKSIKGSINNEQSNTLSQHEEKHIKVTKSNVEVTQEISTPLKKKLLQVADDILENDRKKKRKKRKQPIVEQTNPTLFDEDKSKENTDLQIMKKNKTRIVSATNINEDDEVEVSNEKKKKKKKKKKKMIHIDIEEPPKEDLCEDLIATKPESNNKRMHTEEKKKKKREKMIENVTEWISLDVENKAPTKKKAQREEVSLEKLSKKKQKLLKDSAPQDEKVFVEELPKKRKGLLSKDGKREESSLEKLPKKRKRVNDAVSNSKKEPEVVAFSKARDEALGMRKHAADLVKTNKKIKKKQQGEHMEKVQKEKEIKSQKLEPKNQIIKSNKVEVSKKTTKRLPDDILEVLSALPQKKRKLSKFEKEVLPSRSSYDKKAKGSKSLDVEDFIPLSSSGSTAQFTVTNLQKMKKKKKVSEAVIPLSSSESTTQFTVTNLQRMKKKKKVPKVVRFRPEILARNF